MATDVCQASTNSESSLGRHGEQSRPLVLASQMLYGSDKGSKQVWRNSDDSPGNHCIGVHTMSTAAQPIRPPHPQFPRRTPIFPPTAVTMATVALDCYCSNSTIGNSLQPWSLGGRNYSDTVRLRALLTLYSLFWSSCKSVNVMQSESNSEQPHF